MAVDQQVPGVTVTTEDRTAPPPPRDASQIQADIASSRASLVSNISELKARTSPRAVAANAADKVRSTFLEPSGELRRERVLAVAGGVVALLLVKRGIGARRHRKELRQLAEVVWVPVPRKAVNPELHALARNARELAPLMPGVVPAAITAG